MRLDTGTRLGPYEIEGHLGTGGYGEVYRARDLRLARSVALKVLPSELAGDVEALGNFEREAQAVAALSHPNILAIFDFRTDEGIVFAVTELLEGETLRIRLAVGALPWRKAAEIAAEIADGLAAAHTKGIVHRDLKPENIFLTSDGRVKILDFGLAAAIAPDPAVPQPEPETIPTKPLTAHERVIQGTLGYMSPEQVRGEPAQAASDIFSLGCVLYEMIAGQRPFLRKTEIETLAAVLASDVAPSFGFGGSGKEVPPEVDQLVRRCLCKNPEERFAAARDLAFALRQASNSIEGVGAGRATSPRRHRSLDSLAVLPFENVAADPGLEYLTEGIADTLIRTLSQLPKLRIMARSVVFRYQGKSDAQEAGRALNVAAVLTGRVALRGRTLAISTELVDVANGWQLWGEQYNREPDELLAVQEEIAAQIFQALKVKLSGADKKRIGKRPTRVGGAYRLYLEGRYHWNLRTPDGFKKGIEFFQQAIEKDPRYALAYSGLADCFNVLGNFTLMPPEIAYPRAKAAAAKALEIDAGLAEAHVSYAFPQLYYDWNFAEAETGFRRAIEINPAYAVAHQWYAIHLGAQGRAAESVDQAVVARDLDPLSLPINMTVGWMLYEARRYDEAIEQLLKTLEIDAKFSAARFFLGLAYHQGGATDRAIAELLFARQVSAQNPRAIGALGYLYGASGRRGEARKCLEDLNELSKATYVAAYELAAIYVGLGEKEDALGWLAKAYEERSGWLIWLNVDPVFDPLRGEPKFQELAAKIGLPGSLTL